MPRACDGSRGLPGSQEPWLHPGSAREFVGSPRSPWAPAPPQPFLPWETKVPFTYLLPPENVAHLPGHRCGCGGSAFQRPRSRGLSPTPAQAAAMPCLFSLMFTCCWDNILPPRKEAKQKGQASCDAPPTRGLCVLVAGSGLCPFARGDIPGHTSPCC